MTDGKLIRERIGKSGFKYNFIAQSIGISPQSLRRKINGDSDFMTEEATKLCDVLGITSPQEKDRLFFAKKVDLQSAKERK